jgi:shikimate 5-dehydrogenase
MLTISKEIAKADILVNATLVGMKPNDGVSLVTNSLLRL